MLHKIKVLALVSLVAFLGFSTFVISAPPVSAAETIEDTCTQWQIDQGLCTAGLRTLALDIVNWFLLFLGLIATGFLIYGGFMYVTSAGNDENVGKAKKVIIYAAVGIMVIVIAAVMVNALIGIVDSSAADNS